MDSLIKTATENGVLALIVLACFWFIWNENEKARIERQEVADTIEKMHQDALLAITNNTSALVEIKTIISNK